MKDTAIAMRKAGASLTEICQKLSKSKTTVWYWIREVKTPERLTDKFKEQARAKKATELEKVREERRQATLAARLISGDGRWMIRAPEGYRGRTYIKGLYVYEHRYVMEQKLGRLLSYNEVVHHKNGNKLDNDLDNLELKLRPGHTHDHSTPAKKVTLTCAFCGKPFEREQRIYAAKVKAGQKRFFCCRSHQVSQNQKDKHAGIA